MSSIIGRVIHGKQIGRTIKFPTANLDVKDHNLQKATVHCGYAYLKGQKYKMVMCVNWENIIEVHLLDYKADEFYDATLEITNLQYIRDMHEITNMEKLKNTIQNDVNKARTILK